MIGLASAEPTRTPCGAGKQPGPDHEEQRGPEADGDHGGNINVELASRPAISRPARPLLPVTKTMPSLRCRADDTRDRSAAPAFRQGPAAAAARSILRKRRSESGRHFVVTRRGGV